MDLTKTATFAKRAIVISIILLVLSVIAFISYKIYTAYKIANTPPPEEKANNLYGQLAKPDFPKSLTDSSKYSYTVDTKTGSLESFGNTIRVYFMPKPFATLLASEKANQLASKLKIDTSPQTLTDTKYLYTQDDKNITIEIDSTNFTYDQQTLEEADQGPVEDDQKLIQNFRNFLSSRSLLRDELKEGRTKIELARINDDGSVSLVSSRSEATGAIVSIWPSDLDQKPIVTPKFNESLINATIQTSAQDIENYKSIQYTFWPIDTNSFAVYPLKKTEAAFEELKSGEGIVVLEPPKSDVSITSVYLAYFQSQNYKSYLQPVYVFEGPGFAAYVSALSN